MEPPPDPTPPVEEPAPSRIAQLKVRAAEAQEWAVELRKQVPPVDIAWTAFERDRAQNGNVIAGAVAFRLFVYLLPLYLTVLIVTGVAFTIDKKGPEDLSEQAGLSSYLATTIADAGQTSKESLWILVPVTLYALASAGLSAYRTLATGHARAWGLGPGKVRPWVVVPSFFVFTLAAILTSFVSTRLRHDAFAPVVGVGSAAVYFGLCLAAQHYLPRAAGTTTRDLVPGAVLVAIGTQGLYWFNLLYLNDKVQSSSEAYGVLGVAATTLLWLYLIGRLLVAAPMLNATLWQRDETTGDPPQA